MTDGPGKEVAKVEDRAPAPASQFGLAAMWQGLVDLARDDTVDAAKLAALTSIQGQMIDREAQRRYLVAKNAARAEMPKITRNKRIVHERNGVEKLIGRYRDFDSLRIIIDPILAAHGITLSHTTGESAVMKAPTVSAILTWTDGEMTFVEQSDPMPIPVDTTGAKSPAQGVASSVTYGKRHTTVAILGIVFEGDDDDATPLKVVAALTPEQEEWLHGARVAAGSGVASYQAWFTAQDKHARAWLVSSGEHEALKRAAFAHDEGRTEE